LTLGAAFDAIIDEHDELDLQYDDDTNHGETMGAVFPPFPVVFEVSARRGRSGVICPL
jgi:hypothetical protein